MEMPNTEYAHEQKLAPNGKTWRQITYPDTPAGLARYLARHPYAWPGGSPCIAITDDGGVLCPGCCAREYREIRDSYSGDGWHIVAIDTYDEGPPAICDHCSGEVASAYGDPDCPPETHETHDPCPLCGVDTWRD